MKKKVNLEEAKKILKTDKIYEAGRDKFSVPLFGRGQPNLTAVIPREFMLNSEGHPANPLESECLSGRIAKDIVYGLNLWDMARQKKDSNYISMIAGTFRESRNGKPVFELCPATKATHLLITDERDWSDNSPRSNGHTNNGDASYFRGSAGNEYWVVPTDWYNGEKPMQEVLTEIQGLLDKREAEAEDRYGKFLEKQAELAVRRDEGGKLLKKDVPPLLKGIRKFDPDFVCERKDDGYIRLGTPAYGEGTCKSYDISNVDDIIASLNKSLNWLAERSEEKIAVENAGIDAEQFNIDQIHELAKGLKAGLSPEQVRAYANPNLTAWDFYEIDLGDSMTWLPDKDNIQKVNQMEFLRESLIKGVPTENVKLCAEAGLSRMSARELLDAMDKYGIIAENLRGYPLKAVNSDAMKPIVGLVADGAPDEIKDFCFRHADSGKRITAIADAVKAGLTAEEILANADPEHSQRTYYNPEDKAWYYVGDFTPGMVEHRLHVQGLTNEKLENCGIRHQDFPVGNLGGMACLLDAGASPDIVTVVAKDEKENFSEISCEVAPAAAEGMPGSVIVLLMEHDWFNIVGKPDILTAGLRDGLSEKELLLAADPKRDNGQAEAICDGFRAGMSFKDVEKCADAGYDNTKQLMEGLSKNDPWSLGVVAGYPSYSHWHREGGATNIGHAYVIRSDGTLREPDKNKLRNPNHRFKYSDPKNNADGVQTWYRLRPGEIVVSASKEFTRAPLVVSVDWADSVPDNVQLETAKDQISGLIEEFDTYAVSDPDSGDVITDIDRWLKEAVNGKVEECRERLDRDYLERIDKIMDRPEKNEADLDVWGR